jgi:hypothetical protein
LNLKAAVEREKAVQAIDVHREWKNCVVTFWLMSQFLHFLGAPRGCGDFRDPTAVFRLNQVEWSNGVPFAAFFPLTGGFYAHECFLPRLMRCSFS